MTHKFKDKQADGVSIITCTNKLHLMNNVFENYKNQVYKKKELIVILNRDDMKPNEWKNKAQKYPNISFYQLPEEKSLGECLNFAVNKTKYGFIATFDDDDYYAPYYLTDLMNEFKYIDADVVGKRSYFVYLESISALVRRFPEKENMYVDFVSGGRRIVKRKVFDFVQFRHQSINEDIQFCKDCIERGYKIYSSDRYNHVYFRSANPDHHTWKIDDKKLLKKSLFVTYTKDYKSYVNRLSLLNRKNKKK